jgi:aldehyde dehydrogenase (NAD+)
MEKNIGEIFKSIGCDIPLAESSGRVLTCPMTGEKLACIAEHTLSHLEQRIKHAKAAQQGWSNYSRARRVALLEQLGAAIKQHRDALCELIMLDAGKTRKEAEVEVDGSADVLLKTIKDASLPEMNGMLRTKERAAVGIVGLITSFNFPLVVAVWTIAPALLAGNAVVWKPSEKTPLVAMAYKAIFDKVAGLDTDLLQLAIGGREIGEALVASESVDMISATGSVAMGKGIKATLAKKRNNCVRPILELGGNNGVVISDKVSADHLAFTLSALMQSFLGTTGQRCTNTRRLIVHKNVFEQVVTGLRKKIEDFIAARGEWENHAYGALIDKDAFARFERAKKQVTEEGGDVLFGKRIPDAKHPDAYVIEPALAVMKSQASIMLEETFAPLLYIVSYEGGIEQAMALVNAPDNAGLVNGIYTLSQHEADCFAALNQAGHSLINSPKGTGTPAYGMGFGGNKASGEGEILNSADPLHAFTRETHFSRIAQNKDVVMQA